MVSQLAPERRMLANSFKDGETLAEGFSGRPK
jgi:hypothetical protein